ncbi:cytochrome o ubiquinol oxidase subunit IV [Thioclava atlantica]|uniref:Cytochrome C oxidase subunit IV n=1 Tax=Thioclava atlantica TaxID=1317124 RepID=A0A085TU03_9RHOB|nr:cytochrome-c oxidase [Thioclava atlantica]KFE34200.1 cytochrome C oxidase subunit IV [Thioclava atlantica]
MSDETDKRREARSYLIGLGLALALTLPVFALVAWDLAPRMTILWVTAIAAVLQIAAHLRFFLHIRLKGQTREDLHLILFTTLILLLMGGGTIWLLWNLHTRMG